MSQVFCRLRMSHASSPLLPTALVGSWCSFVNCFFEAGGAIIPAAAAVAATVVAGSATAEMAVAFEIGFQES